MYKVYKKYKNLNLETQKILSLITHISNFVIYD